MASKNRASTEKAAAGAGRRERARIADETVVEKTGLGWEQWFGLLDRAGSLEKSHEQIARWLHEQRAVSPWWAQTITVAYEQERGRRELHQSCDGDWAANGSKTIAVPIEEAFEAWNDASRRARWLADPGFSVRKASPPRSLRITWGDGRSQLDVYLSAKGPAKCLVQVQHRKLQDADEVAERKTYWKQQLAALAAMLTP